MGEQSSIEAVIVGELGELRAQQARLLAGLGEVKAEIVSLQSTTERVLSEAEKTNGRVTLLETWKQQVVLQEATDKGRLEGSSTAALTKGQVRTALAVLTAVSALSGSIVGIVVRLL